MRFIYILFFYSILFSCNETKTTTSSTSQSSPSNEFDENLPVNITQNVIGKDSLQGYIIQKGNYFEFYECGSSDFTKLFDPRFLVERIIDGVAFLPFEGEKYYGEFVVEVVESKDDETQVTTNFYRVLDIIKVGERTFRDACQQDEIWVYDLSGNTAWQLQISKYDGFIVFKDKLKKQVYVMNYVAPILENGKQIYTSVDEKGNTIKVELEEKLCKQIPNEKDFNFQAKITLNNNIYNDCAVN